MISTRHHLSTPISAPGRRPAARLVALVAAAACLGIAAAGPASAESAAAQPAAPSATQDALAAVAASAAGTPVTTEPVTTEPATELVVTEPATELVVTEPATELVVTEPATEPVLTEPATEPATTEPVSPAARASGRTTSSIRAAAVAAPAVATKPVVTTQPVETWVDLGESATFTAHASGTPAPTVQWQFRRWTEDTWVDIPGATSDSYTSPPASVDDVEPGYRAIFTNSAGSVATQSADLRVNQAPPPAGTPSAPRTVKARQTAPGQITITWSAPADEGDSAITSYGAGYGTRRWGNGDDFSPSTFKAVFDDIDDGDYTAVVFAVNDAGMGWRVFVPVSVGDVPTAPRHVAAQRSGTTVTVTWASPARPGYGPVDGYAVVLTSGSQRLTRSVPASATSATFRDLPPGTWRVSVTASNVVGPGSTATVSVTVPGRTPAAPSAPAAPAAAAIPAVAPAEAPGAAPAAQLALTGGEGAAQTALALGLLLLGLLSTTAARRLRTGAKA